MAVALALTAGVSGQEHASAAEARRHYLLGTESEARRDLDAAARAYTEAIRVDPRMAVAHDRLGFVYGLQGRTADAIAEFERARECDPEALRRPLPSRCHALVDRRPRPCARGVGDRRPAPARPRGGPLLPRPGAEEARRPARGHRRARNLGPAERLDSRVGPPAWRSRSRTRAMRPVRSISFAAPSRSTPPHAKRATVSAWRSRSVAMERRPPRHSVRWWRPIPISMPAA